MNFSHWVLVILWVIYYAVHSLLAATSVKKNIEKKSGGFFRYYRLFYSFFASITLTLLIVFQYSFTSPVLMKSTLVKYISLILLVMPGMVVMFISIKKYFMLLSGIRSLFQPFPPLELEMEGIHRYVRHPLYAGTILFVWGLFFIYPMLNNLIAVFLLTLYVSIGINFEEKKLVKEFGKKYKDYISDVPKLIPGFKLKK